MRDSQYVPNPEHEHFQQSVSEVLRRLAETRDVPSQDDNLADLRHALDAGKRFAIDSFSCTFCGADRHDVRKLISGPRVFICDGCVGDATAVVTHVLRS